MIRVAMITLFVNAGHGALPVPGDKRGPTGLR